MMIHLLIGLFDPAFIFQNPNVNPITVVSVVVTNPQRPLVDINVLRHLSMSILLLSASVSLPEISCSSNVLALIA